MENIVVVTFTDPSKAYQALSTVKELDASGRLALRSAAVVERQANGQPVVRDNADPMELSGLPDGLVGKLVQGLAGITEPAAIAEGIPFGTTALIAEVDEYAVEVIDGAMGPLGGTVTREATDNVKAERKVAKDDRRAAELQAKKEELEAHRLDHERERTERHNERIDRVEHWLEGKREAVPPPPVASTAPTAQK
jgi:uncharacterized membrane protein